MLNFVSTDGGYYFLGVVLGVVARLRNRVVADDRRAVHPKPWSTEVIFEIGARLYIGVGA